MPLTSFDLFFIFTIQDVTKFREKINTKEGNTTKWRKIKKVKLFYSANPAFHIKHIQEIGLYRLKHVHCLITNNMRVLWYHPSGTFYGQLENMDFMSYVRISRIYYYIWNLWSNINVSHPDSRDVNLAWRSNSLSKFLLKFLNFQHSLIMLKITYEF